MPIRFQEADKQMTRLAQRLDTVNCTGHTSNNGEYLGFVHYRSPGWPCQRADGYPMEDHR